MAAKTKLMLKVENQHGRPLEQLLPEVVNDIGMSRAAEKLGITKTTLEYWLLKLGLLGTAVFTSPSGSTTIVRAKAGLKRSPMREPSAEVETDDARRVALKHGINRAQELIRQYIPEGRNLADELIRKRQAEATAE